MFINVGGKKSVVAEKAGVRASAVVRQLNRVTS
jgi:hypothetical protein